MRVTSCLRCGAALGLFARRKTERETEVPGLLQIGMGIEGSFLTSHYPDNYPDKNFVQTSIAWPDNWLKNFAR